MLSLPCGALPKSGCFGGGAGNTDRATESYIRKKQYVYIYIYIERERDMENKTIEVARRLLDVDR